MKRLLIVSLAAVLLTTVAYADSPLWVTGNFGKALYKVDTTTGALTRVGATGFNGVVALAFHPDGRLFTFTESGTTDVTVPEQLAVFNPVTGEAMLVGSPLPERLRVMPAVVSPDGILYVGGLTGTLKSKLLAIDADTGQPVEVGPFGVDGIMCFAFDAEGTLFAATGKNLYTVNTLTGHATLVVPFGGDIDAVRSIMGIHFGPDGTLFATDFVDDAHGGSSLYRVDRTTGTGTRVAFLGIPQVHSAAIAPPTPLERANRLTAAVESYTAAPNLFAAIRPLAPRIQSGHTNAACRTLSMFRNFLRGPSAEGLSSRQIAQLDLDALWTQTSLDCHPFTAVIVPIVGSTRGVSGRAFNTTATIANAGETDIAGRLLFHPAGASASVADASIAYVLKGHERQTFADLMASFGVTGIGSLEIIADRGAVPAVSLTVDDADNSVIVPAVNVENVMAAGSRGVLTAPSDLGRFRMNVGFRTLDMGVTLTARLYDATGTLIRSESLSLPENYSTLMPASELVHGNVDAGQSIVIMVQSGSVIAYASKAANSGNGSTFELVQCIEQ